MEWLGVLLDDSRSADAKATRDAPTQKLFNVFGMLREIAFDAAKCDVSRPSLATLSYWSLVINMATAVQRDVAVGATIAEVLSYCDEIAGGVPFASCSTLAKRSNASVKMTRMDLHPIVIDPM